MTNSQNGGLGYPLALGIAQHSDGPPVVLELLLEEVLWLVCYHVGLVAVGVAVLTCGSIIVLVSVIANTSSCGK